MSAVSNSVTPASSPASTTARVPLRSTRPPKLLHPRPTMETSGPSVPSRRVRTAGGYRPGRVVASLVAASPRFSAPPLPIAGLHLLALCSFAVAQPLFDLLGKNPEFFVAHDSTRGDIVLFALALALGIPLLLLAVEAAFLVAGER